uniref:kinesin-like protein KIF11-A n=2 Tax=Styela clava TaxID=7725 RepID=UPI00193AB287|nr:kinesin-like protein KIF11-A [Styela clava]
MSLRGQSGKQQKADEKVHVAIRCRPLNENEKRGRIKSVVETNIRDKEVRVCCNNNLDKTYKFDKTFGPSSKQVDIYRSVVEPHIDEVLAGYNCTVLAYGQTGTGKTFTMEGERSGDLDYTWENDPLAGIIPRTLSQLFDRLEKESAEFSIHVSLLEIYNELIYDLLSPTDDPVLRRIYDDSNRKGSVIIADQTEIRVLSKSDVYDILVRGATKRRTHATEMNEFSSRSHSVFTITVHLKELTKNVGEEMVKIGKLNLVDLAGSENIGRSGAVDMRAREAGNINQSLLTLGRCITALVDHAPHVPYRESRLTRILQDSLGGATKTSIIATIAPGLDNLEETLSTLDYASRAKNIQNKPKVNQRMIKKTLIKQYDNEIERLRRELVATREKNGVCMDKKQYDEMTERLEELETTVKQRQEELDNYKELFTGVSEELRIKSEEYLVLQGEFHETRQQMLEQSHLAVVKGEHGIQTVKDGLEVVAVTDEVTDNIDKVHNKVDRMKHADNANETAAKNHCTRISNKAEGLNSQTSEIIQMNKLYMENSIKNLDAMSERRTREKNEFDQMLLEFQTSVDQSVKDCKDTLTVVVSETEDKIKDQNDFLTEKEEQMNAALSRFQESCTSRMAEMHKKIQATLKIASDMDSFFRKQMMKQHEMITQEFEKNQEKLMEEVLNTIKSQFASSVESYNSKAEELKEELEKESDIFMQKTQSSLQGIEESFVETVQESLQHGESTSNLMQLCNSKVENISANIMEDMRDTEEKVQAIVDDDNETATTFCTSAKNLIEESVQSNEKDIASLQDMMTSSSKLHDQISTVVTDGTTELTTITEEFCDSELIHVKPTGETPARKDYSYPKNFQFLPPDDELLKSFNERMQIEMEEEEERLAMEEKLAKERELASGNSSIENISDISEPENVQCGTGKPFFMAQHEQKRSKKNQKQPNSKSRLPLKSTQNIH